MAPLKGASPPVDKLAACPVGGERHLTPGEVEVARTVFGDAIDYSGVQHDAFVMRINK